MINTISNLESAASIRETLNQMVAIVNYYSASQFGGSTTTTTQSPSTTTSTTTSGPTTTTTSGPGETTTSTTQNFGPSTSTTTNTTVGPTSTTTSNVITITVWDGTSGTNAGGVTTSQMACSTVGVAYSHTVYLQPGPFHQYNGQPVPGDALFNDIAKTNAIPANYYGYSFVGTNQYLEIVSNGVIQNRDNCSTGTTSTTTNTTVGPTSTTTLGPGETTTSTTMYYPPMDSTTTSTTTVGP